MTGLLGNSEFFLPENLNVSRNEVEGTLRFEGNKIHCSPRDQSLSDLLIAKQMGQTGGKQTITLLTNDVQQRSTFRE